MEEFLAPTKYCDYSHPLIQRWLKEIRAGGNLTTKELAVKVFYFVRDHILYRVGNWKKKASETLKEGYGTCTNSANLMVALLRGLGIPSGYGVMKVLGKEYFGPIVPISLRKHISEKSTHVYCYVFLDGKWVKCDSSDDESFAKNTCHLNPQSQIVDWTGEDHAILHLDKEHILKDEGPVANIDDIFGKRHRLKARLPTNIGNLYIEFLRQYGRKFSNCDRVDVEFRCWLKRKHIFCYFIYMILSKL